MTVRSRRPPPLANQLPMMVSVSPGSLPAVGGVEEVDSRLVGDVHDGVRVFLGGSGPEVHRAETKPGDSEAGTAQIGEIHMAAFHLRAAGGSTPPAPGAGISTRGGGCPEAPPVV
jgi:hypothetical protein